MEKSREEEIGKAIKDFKYFKPLTSTEYRRFLIEEFLTKPRESIYEKLCNSAEKVFRIRLSAETEKNFYDAIQFTYLNISPSGPISLVSLLLLIISPLLIISTLFGFLSLTTTVVAFVIFALSSYYIYKYPFFRVREIRAKASTEIVLAIVYMAVSLREIPNLENAVVFAASNLTGPLSRDLKRLLWKIETQQFSSIEPAIDEFTRKWGEENQEFVNAIKLLKSSVQQPPDRAHKLIDESIDVILSGTADRMSRYANDLRMPVTMIYALGIILPVITLVIFPIIMIFLQQYANISFLIVGYDILLPVSLFWFINTNLKAKPPTVSQPDIREKLTDINLFNKTFSVLFIAIPILLILGSIGGYLMYQYQVPFSLCREWQTCNSKKPFDNLCKPDGFDYTLNDCKNHMSNMLTPTLSSSLIIWAIAFSSGISLILMTQPRLKMRNKVKVLEKEFSEALFQLGHEMMSGHGIENALDNSQKNLGGMEIASFYGRILSNIKALGATFENAIFSREYGAVWDYPSEIIRSVMKIIVEASKKSLVAASTSMLTVSKYLKGMDSIEEKIKDIMSETVTSMKFLGMFLSPLVAGITVGMAVIILSVITLLSITVGSLGGSAASEIPTSGTFLLGLWQGGASVGPDMFQLVLGIYIIETTVLLGMFVNGLENGEDKISELNLIGKMLLLSVGIYTISLFVIYSVFGGLLRTLLMGV
ncbi:MAG: hypothetical protein V1944_00335 [Candidatus Aenigmatarchaeota archaeon]